MQTPEGLKTAGPFWPEKKRFLLGRLGWVECLVVTDGLESLAFNSLAGSRTLSLPSSAGRPLFECNTIQNLVHLCFFPFFFFFLIRSLSSLLFLLHHLPPSPHPSHARSLWLLPFPTNGAMNLRQKQLHQRCFLLNCQLIGSIFQQTDKSSALHAGTGVPCDITRYLRTNICYFCDSVVR